MASRRVTVNLAKKNKFVNIFLRLKQVSQMPCEAARQRHGDGRHQGGGGGSAREAAAAGGGGGSLAAAWWAERRQRSGIGSFLSAGRWEWKRGGGIGVGSSAATARLQQAALQQRLQHGIGGGSAVAASAERQ
jgi:hypothetical protein